MNRASFLADADVAGFLDFFSRCLRHLEVDYVTAYPQILPADRHFHVTGVAQAHASYAWPAKNTFVGPPNPSIYNWATTAAFLSTARAALHRAIAARNDPATWDAVYKILVWGLGSRGAPRGMARLRTDCAVIHAGSISAFVGHTQTALRLGAVNTTHINPGLIPYASSGTAKIHSLASTDGLVIFDSRVAATLGECINEYLRRQRALAIPDTLQIFIELNHGQNNPLQRVPRPLANGANHAGFPRTARTDRWIACQVRASWMFEAVLQRNQDIFPNLPLPDRMHRLEAACFMMGAYLQPGPFAGRAFNFGRC